VATNTAGGITMKLATAINTLKQEFGLYNVESYRQHEGQFKPYGFTMDTDKFLIEVVHPNAVLIEITTTRPSVFAN
jgi:hypothetical protein